MTSVKERNEKVKEVINSYNGLIQKLKVIGSKGDTYDVIAIKKNKKIVDVVCNCKGYYYRTKCWHTEKYSIKNPYWERKNKKWKK